MSEGHGRLGSNRDTTHQSPGPIGPFQEQPFHADRVIRTLARAGVWDGEAEAVFPSHRRCPVPTPASAPARA